MLMLSIKMKNNNYCCLHEQFLNTFELGKRSNVSDHFWLIQNVK